MTDPIRLVQIKGPTSVNINVRIDKNGDLLFSGFDIGDVPQEIFGDADYEYWLRIPAEHKDRVLLALIEKHYSGNTRLISEIQSYLKSTGIPCEFTTWI